MATPAINISTRIREIGIDGGTWSNRRGYGRFLRELLPELVRLRPEWRFTVFLDQFQEDTIAAPNLKWITAHTGRSVADDAAADSARSATDLLRMSQAVNRVTLDLLFFPTVYSYFPVLRRLPVVVGIHDTMADRYPQWAFAGKRQELLWRAKMWLALARATRIVTVSEYSRRSIADHYSIDAERITVLSEGAAPVFRHMPEKEEPFILAVGGISPNKNLGVLIAALAKLRVRRPELRLVLVGDYQKDGFQGCYEELKEQASGLAVEFAGYVPDAELAGLYNRCMVFAMPSLEEGFGLPLVEAMACGCACVVASGHALEEVGGDAVALVSEDWVGGLERVLDDPDLRATFRRKALARAPFFTWQRGAQALVDVFEELLPT